MFKSLFMFILLGVGAITATTSNAQQPASTFPVIVVFHDHAPFQNYRANYRADGRASANPDAWRYLNRDVVGTVMALEARLGFRSDHVYSAAIRGFAARLTARQIDEMENDPFVAYVEADGIMTTSQTLPWGIDRIDADVSSTMAGNGSGTVSNVNVYVIDTGIDYNHPDLYVVRHVNFAGGQNIDCNGHGTHVAGTVAARDNTIDVVGAAPGAKLTGVKVLGCSGSGTTSGVIKGTDWVRANAVKPAVANMSLGGGKNATLNNAVIALADSGVLVSVAAGNSGANACNYSPAAVGTHNGVITVAATDSNDKEASFSNFGSCVDIWAPGVSIPSTKKNGGTTTMSGTSMAAPHVAGTAALYLSNNPGASPATVESKLVSDAKLPGTTSKDGAFIELLYAGYY